MISLASKYFRALIMLLPLAGCAAGVVYAPAEFTPVATAEQTLLRTLAKDAAINFDTGYSRPLKAGSQWMRIGRVSQGDVYKPHKDIFAVEGKHVHEAYLVIASDTLVGFYLPVERSFSSVNQKVSLRFQ